MAVDCKTEVAGAFRQIVTVDAHTLAADVGPTLGGQDSAPGPHDYFDVSLATCKALTATWYAKKNAIPLERVESHVERDSTQETHGVYVLKVRLAFHGPLTDEQRAKLYDVVGRCPIHKLMTTTDVHIETASL